MFARARSRRYPTCAHLTGCWRYRLGLVAFEVGVSQTDIMPEDQQRTKPEGQEPLEARHEVIRRSPPTLVLTLLNARSRGTSQSREVLGALDKLDGPLANRLM